MTFKKAYEYAMEHSDRFRKHDAHVKEMAAKGEPSGCMFFTVEPGETFYYGFDGCEMQKGKHTRRTSDRLIKAGDVLIIL